jgi:carbon-monoxide dehydrogenase medium subunit
MDEMEDVMKEISYAAPSSVAKAAALLAEAGDRGRVLAGGTDIIVQVREGRRDVDLLVDIKRIAKANELVFNKAHGLRLGSAVPCVRIYESKKVARAYPGLIDAVSLIGGIQIQSRASVGGNLCNASPAADTIPALIAHETVCVIAGPTGTREVAVESFCTAPGRTVLGPGEFLLGMSIPAPKPCSGAAYLRFIPRNEMDIAVVGAGVSVTLDESRKRCIAARVALAAVAPTPLFVPDAGAALVDGELRDELIDKAAALSQAAAKPISDMRGDADYRRHLVAVLVRRAIRKAIDRATES